VTSNLNNKIGLRYSPFCFTKQGVTMLACILNSKRVIVVNIQVIRVFTRMREILLTNKNVLLKLEQLDKQSLKNTDDIQLIFQYLKKLLTPIPRESRKQIGYKRLKEG
jgi:phage regulator Rha-like protein